MERRIVNPWTWQDAQGWSWAIETRAADRVLYCAGQVPMDGQGRVLHPGDMAAQVGAAFDNLEVVLGDAGYTVGDLVRIDYYTTSADRLMAAWDEVARRLIPAGCRAGGVLLEVSRLALPELQIEIQAIAVR